jgi:hypothetical protein
VDPELVGDFRIEATAAPFDSKRGTGWEQARLACHCGGRSFRVVGWPRSAGGKGGPIWQTFSRAFREARAALRLTDAQEPLFSLPLFATCERCGREILLLDDERVPARVPAQLRHLPRESYRCRVCRRGAVGVAVAYSEGPPPRGGASVEVHVHCNACHCTSLIAGSDSRAGEQEQRLDLLYGRR